MAGFRLLKQFNDPDAARSVDRRKRLVPGDAAAFPGDGLGDKFARALCAHRATRFRELVEAFEFFAVARRSVRAEVIVDLCAGHGLVGVLYVVFERAVRRAIVVDKRRTQDFDRVLAAAAEVAPWTAGRIEFLQRRLENVGPALPENAGYVAVHACGARTDRVLDFAIAAGAPVAVMPCCHDVNRSAAPVAIKQALGDVAVDVDRTYRLQGRGFAVRWAEVSSLITRKNRVLVAEPREALASPTAVG